MNSLTDLPIKIAAPKTVYNETDYPRRPSYSFRDLVYVSHRHLLHQSSIVNSKLQSFHILICEQDTNTQSSSRYWRIEIVNVEFE